MPETTPTPSDDRDPLLTVQKDDYSAELFQVHSTGRYGLDWTDGINEWAREYDDMGTALLALGVLQRGRAVDLNSAVARVTALLTTIERE